MKTPIPFRRAVLLAGIAAAIASSGFNGAMASEVSGIQVDETTSVAGKGLVLCGSGTRTKAGLFKVYVIGVYLSEHKSSAADVISAAGPKRFKLTMLRDVSGDDFGSGFLTAINKNLDKDEKQKLVNQLAGLGEVFENVGGLKKGDVILGDWVPGTGASLSLNGKPVLPVQPEPLFYNALLRIWYGEKPVEDNLKAELLGKSGKTQLASH